MGTHNAVDTPGKVHFFAGHGPAPVLGDCPHTDCPHNAQSVIAWGPDWQHYELLTCDVPEGCAGRCRSWGYVEHMADKRMLTNAWKHVGQETPLPYHDRDIEVGAL